MLGAVAIACVVWLLTGIGGEDGKKDGKKPWWRR